MTATSYLASIPSPPQGVWHIGPVAIRAYAVCIIIGIVVGVWWGNKRFVARGGRPGRITDLAVFMVPFGLIGGRLYHVITDHELYFGPGRNPWTALAIWQGGLGIWGAIALGGLGAWIGCRYYKIPLPAVADSLAPAIAVAQAIGRLGNYFNQELFGSPTTVPWALEVFVRTPGGIPGANTFGVNDCEFPTEYIKATPEVLCGVGTYHPTFLYELLWNLGVAALVVWADRRFRLGGGRAFALYVAGYTAGRCWIELLRIDPARTHLFGLRINVVTSIVLFLAAVAYLVIRRNAEREDPATLKGRPSGAAAKLESETAESETSEGSAVAPETAADQAGEDGPASDRADLEPEPEPEPGPAVAGGVADPPVSPEHDREAPVEPVGADHREASPPVAPSVDRTADPG